MRKKHERDWDNMPWWKKAEIDEEMERIKKDKERDGGDSMFKVYISLTQIKAFVIGATSLAFNLEERGEATGGSAGTDVMDSELVADVDGVETTSFSNAALDAEDYLVFTTGTSAETGTVTSITVTVFYT